MMEGLGVGKCCGDLDLACLLALVGLVDVKAYLAYRYIFFCASFLGCMLQLCVAYSGECTCLSLSFCFGGVCTACANATF